MQSIFSRFGQMVLSNVASHLRPSAPPAVSSLLPSAHPTAAGPLTQQVRGILRKFMPRVSNIKRLSKHSYETRLQTKGGRYILMRRYLKGRHSLSH